MYRTLPALLLVLLVLWPTAAAMADTKSSLSPSTVAEHLAEDPVYVHPSRGAALSDEQARELRERIVDEDLNVYIAVTPWREAPESMVTALIGRSEGPGVFLAVGDGGPVVGRRSSDDRSGVSRVTLKQTLEVLEQRPDMIRADLEERLHVALDMLGDERVAAREHARLSAGPVLDPRLATALLWGLAALPLLALVVWGMRRRSRRPLRVVPLSEAVVGTVDSTEQETTRRELEPALVSYGRRVSRFSGNHARATTALEAYEAAAKVLDTAEDMADLVGARVLLDHCEAALSGDSTPRHCFFDPRHEGQTGKARWRAPASHRSVTVRACARCRRDLKEHRVPMTVLASSGRVAVPYYAVPARESVWAATGYGTLAPDLAARVLRGDDRG